MNVLTKALDFSAISWVVYLFFGLFVVLSLFEIIVAYLQIEKARKIIKPLCMLFLSLAALIYNPQSWLIYLGAFLGTIGDIFLLWKSDKRLLYPGILAFFLGHVCYIAEIIIIIAPSLNWAYYVSGAVLVVLFNFLAYPFTKKITKDGVMATAVDIYVSVLVMVPIAGLVGSFLGYSNFLLAVFLGGLSFAGSDLILSYTLFKHEVKRQDFFIMGLYLLGQALIVIGLALTAAIQ